MEFERPETGTTGALRLLDRPGIVRVKLARRGRFVASFECLLSTDVVHRRLEKLMI